MLEFYFIEIANFQSYNDALNLSQEIHNSGGAGYIYFDEKYHVLASYYSRLESANSVLKNIQTSYPNSSILTIVATPFSNSNLSTKEKIAVESFLTVSEQLILELEQFSTEYNKGELSINKFKTQTKNMCDGFLESYNNFISTFKKNSKLNIAKDYASQMLSALINITKLENQNLSSSLRYELIGFVINRYHLLSCF